MRKSAKKQQFQVQMIQRTVTHRNVTQDNGYITTLEGQSLVLPSMHDDLLLFLTTRIKKMAVWKTTFVSEHLNTNQSQLTKCFAQVLHRGACRKNIAPWKNVLDIV